MPTLSLKHNQIFKKWEAFWKFLKIFENVNFFYENMSIFRICEQILKMGTGFEYSENICYRKWTFFSVAWIFLIYNEHFF